MGGALSKAGRKLPKRPEPPSWAGARTPGPTDPLKSAADRRASEKRTQDIIRDAHDPDFLANLNRLGPVRVNEHMPTMAASTAAAAKETSQLFQSRLESEHEAASTSPIHNRLHASALSYLLDQRKAARSPQDLENLAKKYGIDPLKLANLSRYVSSPSIQSGSEVRIIQKDGEENIAIQNDVHFLDFLPATMFKRAGSVLNSSVRKFHSKVSSTAHSTRSSIRGHPGIVLSSGAAVACVFWYANGRTIHNDSASPVASENAMVKKHTAATGGDITDSDNLRTIVWGSNKANTLTSESEETIRTPSVAKWLDGVALRDLVIYRDSAACVDSRGDVYQWGSGFAGEDSEKRKPTLTLREKNITELKLTEGKLYALSASGKVYVLSTQAALQTLRPGAPTPSSDSWWGTGWLWGEDETVDFAEITPAEQLSWGEKIVSIDAGDHHVLALTSNGRVFAHPVDKKANAYGQLGFRKFQIPDPTIHHRSKTNGHLDVELFPKPLLDSFVNSSRTPRPNPEPTMSENLLGIDDSSVRFCTHFFEVPVLKGIQMAQVAAGGRSSYARTSDGRVLSWGANDFGQSGLGSNVALDTITVPTEVVLWKSSASRKDTKCLDLAADSDATQSLQPIVPHAVTISPTGHVLLTLNTASTTGVGGRDLVVWGKNYESELGNGKKSSVPVPMTLETPEGDRFMLRRRTAKRVLDMHGKLWKRNVQVEQCAVVGPENSAVYWKIV
ncbi:hypothetical protein H0H93_005396 [Arthromyces matolae]|nr:hypothetical protein H0H93_005396 [Arthromyces matolae]